MMLNYVSNIPTKEEKARNNARIPCSFGNKERTQRSESSSPKRSQAANDSITFPGQNHASTEEPYL